MVDTQWVHLGPCRAVHGFLPGFARPVLLAELRIAEAALGDGRLTALEKLLRPSDAAMAPAQIRAVSPVEQLVERIAQAVLALLSSADMPLFGSPAVVARDTVAQRFRLALPTLDHAQAPAERALDWVVRWLNQSAADPGNDALIDELPALRQMIRRAAPRGMNTGFFLQAAWEAGIPWRRVVGNVYQFGWGARGRWFDSAFTEQTSNISARLARDKRATLAVLRHAGLPVPVHAQAADPDAAERLAHQIGFPVVVKPANLDGGRGVTAELRSPQAVREAFARARALSPMVLVEKHIEGNDYRLHVFQERVIFALHRLPGGVTGDGDSPVRELLERLNADPLRGDAGTKALLKRVALDDEALGLLREQDLTPDAVPVAGRFVRLRRTANLASGGTPLPVLEQVHPDNLALAVRAARILRLDLAGVDLLMPDIRRSWLEVGAAICEINAQPQLWSTLPAQILRALVSGDGRIPTVLIFGDDSQRGWVDALAQRLGERGLSVGLAAPDAVRVGGRIVTCLPTDAYGRAAALFADPAVEIALIRVADAALLTTGLPVDRFDVLVLAGPPEAREADAQAWREAQTLARAVQVMCRGPVIVNADCAPWEAAAASLRVRERTPLALCRARDLADAVTAALAAHEW